MLHCTMTHHTAPCHVTLHHDASHCTMTCYIALYSVWTQYSRTRDTPPGRITLHHTAISRQITPLHVPLQDHVKGKPHKRRLHALKTDPYTIEESLRAAGISILHPPSSIHHLHVLCSPSPHSSHLLPPTPNCQCSRPGQLREAQQQEEDGDFDS